MTSSAKAIEPLASSTVDFTRDIRPILSDHCYACHGPDAASRAAGLRLDQADAALADLGGYAAVVAGDPEASELIARIEHEDPDQRMPPAETKKRLTSSQRELLRRWIEEGARYEKHWAFVPPERAKLPGVADAAWPLNAIDHFVLAELEARGLRPSAPATKSQWLRRVTLDLTGLPPTPGEVDAFVRDESPLAFQRVVDRLLQSERYGEAMALDWLDAARYADTDGYQNDGPREMWPWRDWVVRAYNAGMPFDQFTIEQLAGDLLPHPTRDQLIATGFNRNHRYNSEAGLVLEEFLLENAVDRVDTTSTVWMGLTMGCARCHDHKFDPVSQREYYRLIAYFDQVAESGRAVKFGNSEPWIQAPTPEQEEELERLDRAMSRIERQWERTLPEIDEHLVSSLAGGDDGWLDLPSVGHGVTHAFELDEPEQVRSGEATPIEGIRRGALHFNGNQRVSLGAVFDARCQSRFSLSFWIRPDKVDEGVILSRQTANTRRPGLAVELRDGRLQFFVITRWLAGVGAVETVRSLEPGQWVHVALTNDGSQSAGGMKIYLNGEEAETKTLFNTNSNTGGTEAKAPLTLGGGVHGANYRGAIDSLRGYGRTLWPDEVRRLADEPSLAAIAAAPLQERTPSEQASLRRQFLEHAAPAAHLALAERWQAARMRRITYADALPTTMIMKDRAERSPTFVRKRGVYDQYGEQVETGVPELFSGVAGDQVADRLAFARWLVSGRHPLTARVTVNRHWQRFFGIGLVDTPGDFGLQGSTPSHPELLDWLATELVRSGWNLQHLQRLIVLSQTYRQSSRVTPELMAVDPDNRWLARGPRQRLAAQVVRDQALALGNLLSHRQGGPSVNTFQPAGLWDEMSNMTYKLSEGEDLYRRSLYTFWKRTVAPPSMAVLDAADRESCSIGIRRTNTPLQALALLNETAFVHAAYGLAYRLLASDDPVRSGFALVTARDPSAAEQRVLRGALDRYRAHYRRNPSLADQLLEAADVPIPFETMVGEERRADAAAMVALANVLLNLDEVISKE